MDRLFADKSIGLVNMCVPFMFLDVLKGGENMIKQNRSRFIIFVSGDDSFSLYETVRRLSCLGMDYQLAFRFDFPMPTRLILYAY